MRKYQKLKLKLAMIAKQEQANFLGKKGQTDAFNGANAAFRVADLKYGLYKFIAIPLLSMWKDVKDTFKPYKTDYGIVREFSFPFTGVKNFFRSIVGLVSAALIPLNFFSILSKPNKTDYAAHLIISTGLMLINSIILLIQGISQIAFAPLALLRLPLRSIITKIKGRPKLEDSKSLRELATKELAQETPLQDSLSITVAMYHKLKKANAHLQSTTIIIPNSNKSVQLFQFANNAKVNSKNFAKLTESLLQKNITEQNFVKLQQYGKFFTDFRELFVNAIKKHDAEIQANKSMLRTSLSSLD